MYFGKSKRFPEQLSSRTRLNSHHTVYLNSEFRSNENIILCISVFVYKGFFFNMSEVYLKTSQTIRMMFWAKIVNSS